MKIKSFTQLLGKLLGKIGENMNNKKFPTGTGNTDGDKTGADNMKKAACYVRVSTENQLENYSIDEQTEKLKNFCKAKDYLSPAISKKS